MPSSYSEAKQYMYFIAVLTKSGQLLADYSKGQCFSDAYDTFLAVHDLAGNVVDYKYCLCKVVNNA